MAVIPIYQSRTETPVPRPTEYAGDPFSGIERSLNLFDRIQEAADRAEAQNLAQTAKAGIEGTIKIAGAEEADPDIFKTRSISGSQEIYQSTLQRARNSRVRQLVTDSLSDNMVEASTAIQLGHKAKQVQLGQANSFEYLKGATKELAQLEDPVKIAKKETEIFEHVNDSVNLRLYSHLEGRKLLDEIHKNKDMERSGYLMMTDPQRLLDELKDKNSYPNLKQSERYTREQQSLERLREFRLQDERLQKEQINQMNGKLLIESTRANVSLTELRERIIQDPSIKDFSVKKLWYDRISESIKAREKGEDDPFFHSQGDIYAQVMKGVIEEPEKWSTTDITRYIGKGLSVNHAKELTGMLEKTQKEGTGGRLSPMAQARNSWELQHKEGGFLNAAEQKRFFAKDPVMIAENDRRAQAVLDKVVGAERAKQDPRNALRIEMQPYHNQTVTTWGEMFLPGSGGFFSGTRAKSPEEVAAAQYVASLGEDASNPQNIQKAMDFLKKKGGVPKPVAPAPGPGLPTLTMPQLSVVVPKVKDFYKKTFGKDLPVSAEGQSATHEKMGFGHHNAMDVAINPTTKEGSALMTWLDANNIPFIGFDRAVPGQSTGPHIHIGNPSPQMMPRPQY